MQLTRPELERSPAFANNMKPRADPALTHNVFDGDPSSVTRILVFREERCGEVPSRLLKPDGYEAVTSTLREGPRRHAATQEAATTEETQDAASHPDKRPKMSICHNARELKLPHPATTWLLRRLLRNLEQREAVLAFDESTADPIRGATPAEHAPGAEW